MLRIRTSTIHLKHTTMASSQVNSSFPHFMDLPAEIRIMIWRECLPYRVHELDSDEFYDAKEGGFPVLCGLRMTTEMNHRPQAISRVCRESRVVALQNRIRLPYEEMPEEADWASDLTMIDAMIDLSRDIVHLNWEPWDERFEEEGTYMQYLAWYAANSQGGSMWHGSIFPARIFPARIFPARIFPARIFPARIFPDQYPFPELTPNLVITMRKIIIHATSEYGARTGLFGLLGDAPVQLVDLSDEKRLKAYFDLAEETQKKGRVTFAQDLHRKPCKLLEEEFRGKIQKCLKKGRKLPPMRGAIMFRLCTDMCNNSEDVEEGFRPLSGTTFIRQNRDEWRGRGRGCGAGARGRFKLPYRRRGRLRNKIVA